MNRTQIEWARNPDGSPGYTLNSASGCRNHTPEGLCLDGLFPCYAYRLAHGRLKPLYLANPNIAVPKHLEGLDLHSEDVEQYHNDPFYPRFWEERLAEMTRRNDRLYYDGAAVGWKRHIHPRGIFVCDMGDLFGIGVPENWTERVLDEIWGNKGYDRFYLLSKQAQNLIRWSPFPVNCWVGVTATNWLAFSDALGYLATVKAPVKYLSFEPLLERIEMDMLQKTLFPTVIDWVIIGACTGTENSLIGTRLQHLDLKVMQWGNKWTLQPKLEWVREIVEAADKEGVRVFLKDNLMPLLVQAKGGAEYAPLWANSGYGTLRQELPG